MDTAYAYSVNPGILRDKYLEGIELVLQAWSATKPFAFNGRFTQMRYVNVLPRPLQRPHPPIWIPGGGSVETWDYCSSRDYVYAALSYYGHLLAKETVAGFWRKVEENGKDPNPYRLAFLQFIGVADTDQEAYRLYKEPAEYFFNRSLHVYPGYTDPPGYVTEASVRARYKSAVHAVARSPSRPSTTSPGTRWSRRAMSSSAAPIPCERRWKTWPRCSTAATCSRCSSSAT